MVKRWIGQTLSVLLLLVVGLCAYPAEPIRAHSSPAQNAGTAADLTVEDVIKLWKAGLSENLIILRIKKNRRSYDLSTDQLIQLKSSSVPEQIIRAMMNPTQGNKTTALQPRQAPAPSSPASATKAAAPRAQPSSKTEAKPSTPARSVAPQASEAKTAPAPSSPAPVRIPAAAPTAGAWTTHNDASGFSVDTPAGWSVATDKQFGCITIQGRQGERSIIWPMFVEDRQLDRSGAAAVLQQIARRIDAEMHWSSPESMGNSVRVSARSVQRYGVVMMMWRSSQNGTAVYAYGVEAPPDVYRVSSDTFAEVLKSFHVASTQPAEAEAQAARKVSGAQLNFVSWKDPREGAFSVSVPQGWKVAGGAYRLTATDIRSAVSLASPDGQIRIALNDPNVGTFEAPNRMTTQFGLREGSKTSIGDGSQLEIRSFRTGQQFIREYVQTALRQQCSDLRVTSNNDRQDLNASFEREVRAEGATSAQVSSGDISFACKVDGRDMQGYYAAVTDMPFPGKGTIWYIYRLYGYLAASERREEADKICQRVVQSWKIDPQWRQKENQIAAEAVQRDNQRSQEIQSRALRAIAEDQRQTSEMISKSYWERQKVYDEISRKRENAILGKVDVVDPATNTQYKIDNFSNYHWIDSQGNKADTQTDTAPGVGWRKMIDLP